MPIRGEFYSWCWCCIWESSTTANLFIGEYKKYHKIISARDWLPSLWCLAVSLATIQPPQCFWSPVSDPDRFSMQNRATHWRWDHCRHLVGVPWLPRDAGRLCSDLEAGCHLLSSCSYLKQEEDVFANPSWITHVVVKSIFWLTTTIKFNYQGLTFACKKMYGQARWRRPPLACTG